MGQKGCRFSLFLFSPVQANLALSPTALLPSPKSPDVKLQPAPLSPSSQSPPTPLSPTLRPQSPQSPSLRPTQQSCEEEDPVSFETPAEGSTLPNFNKTRARLSFKRRPPTRQHRKSASEEPSSPGSSTSPCELPSPGENGLSEQQVFQSNPAQDAASAVSPGAQEEAQELDRDCNTIEEESARSNAEEESSRSEEQGKPSEEEQLQTSEPCAAEAEVNEEEEEKMEEMSEGADQEAKEGM